MSGCCTPTWGAECHSHAGHLRRENQGDSRAARTMFLSALAHDPSNYDALGLLGSLSLDEGKPLLARFYLLRLTGGYKLSSRGYHLLGRSYQATGERDQAVTAFRHAWKWTRIIR